jgi:hypothetical protein
MNICATVADIGLSDWNRLMPISWHHAHSVETPLIDNYPPELVWS